MNFPWLEKEMARTAANLERCPHCGHTRCICPDWLDPHDGDEYDGPDVIPDQYREEDEE